MNLFFLTFLLIAFLVVLGILVWAWRDRRPSMPGSRCDGFDLVEAQPLPRIVECKKNLKPNEIHRLIENLDDTPIQTESGARHGGTMVSQDYCAKHCPGGCKKGCKKNENM